MSEPKNQHQYSIEEAFKDFLQNTKISLSKNLLSKHIELQRKTFLLFSLVLVTCSFLLIAQFHGN